MIEGYSQHLCSHKNSFTIILKKRAHVVHIILKSVTFFGRMFNCLGKEM